MLWGAHGTGQCGSQRLAVDLVGEPLAGVGLHGVGLYTHEVDLRLGELDLPALVEPAHHILLKVGGRLHALAGHALHAELVVQPDVLVVHAAADDVVEVLALGDPGVEAHAAKGLRVEHHAARRGGVGAREARALEGGAEVGVELADLAPGLAVPALLGLGQALALGVIEVAGLGRDEAAGGGLRADAVEGALEEVGPVDDDVVVEEHDGVVAEDRGGEDAEVLDGAVARQARAAGQGTQADLLHAAVDVALLGGSYHGELHVGVAAQDLPHLLGCLVLGAGLGGDQDDDPPQAGDALQGVEAAGEVAGLVDGGDVIVRGAACNAACSAAPAPVGGNDDDRVQVHAVGASLSRFSFCVAPIRVAPQRMQGASLHNMRKEAPP